jgi:hypothetical protein
MASSARIDMAQGVGYLRSVIFTRGKEKNAAWRVVGLLLLLALFSLPLHSHAATETPRIAKECSCVHGHRTEIGIAPVLANQVLPDPYIFHAITQPQICSYSAVPSFTIRAPPLF